jgi:hypothetical protein
VAFIIFNEAFMKNIALRSWLTQLGKHCITKKPNLYKLPRYYYIARDFVLNVSDYNFCPPRIQRKITHEVCS